MAIRKANVLPGAGRAGVSEGLPHDRMMGERVLHARRGQVHQVGGQEFAMTCERPSLAGSVSQRSCVFCGSRVVLYPIADAVHLVHGPIGCAAYTWDIRGSLSSGPTLHRLSFSTDLQERDVIFGGERKLHRALTDLVERYRPAGAFVYSTCITGLIGDDVGAVCRKVEREQGIPVLPVQSEGFKGTKKDGYRAACEAIFKLVGQGNTDGISPHSINILGEFNIGGEAWLIKKYYERMGVEVVSIITGDGRVADIQRSHGAALNVVQCSGSMMHLARLMEERYGIPSIRVSYFGLDDMAQALYDVARHFQSEAVSQETVEPICSSAAIEIMTRTKSLVRDEMTAVYPRLQAMKAILAGKKAAIYVGGGFKALSLIKALRYLGMDTVLVGSQTGTTEDYRLLHAVCDPGTVIVDDSNPVELAHYVVDKRADLLIGGVKERPIAYKLGIGFCDHNHERKYPLAGFEGMLNFAREVHASVASPVWKLTPRKIVP